MTTRSNTIVRPGGLLRWALCLAALVSLLPLRAADDAPARKVAGELAARFRAMKAYTVTFAVEGDDFAAEGSYAVEGDRYYMRVGDAEAYSDGVSKWEVDPSKREVVVDVVDTQSRSLLGNPTRAFDFLDDAFRSELLPSEGEVRRLRLTPGDKGAAMSSITVDVAADGSPRAVIYDLDGERMRIEIRRIEPSAEVRRFDAADYAGYELIDFR